MKGFKPNLEAMKARLEKNKEKRSKKKREDISIYDHPHVKVEGPGKYKFRATYYPHTDDPASEPFPTRHYHFRVPGSGILYCPQMNDGLECSVCDFVWEQMKTYGRNGSSPNKETVKEWSKLLPKARVWVPGRLRSYKNEEGEDLDRWAEGVKFLSFTTNLEKQSTNHKELLSWFYDPDTEDWLSEGKGGQDMVLKYEDYEATGKTFGGQYGPKFGFDTFVLSAKTSAFGKAGEFEAFMESIPNIDTSELPILVAYTKKTPEDADAAMEAWKKRIDRKVSKASGKVAQRGSKEMDTSAPEADEEEEEEGDKKEKESTTKSDLKARLAAMGAIK